MFMLWGGGIEFVRYAYKFLKFTYHRTQSIAECVDCAKFNHITKSLDLTDKKLNLVVSHIEKTRFQLNTSFHMTKDLAKYITEEKDIFTKIKALCKNLDEASIELVFRIISRVKQRYLNPNYQIKFTKEEYLQFEELHTKFFPQIIEIQKDIWAYKGYFLPIRHFEEGVFFYEHSMDTLSPQTLEKIKEKDIIDVGGFIGDSAIIFEHKWTNKSIYSFEAASHNYNLMLQTLKLNESKRIIPIQKALGAKREILEISISGSCSSIHYKVSEQSEKVEVITLDSYVKENNIEVGFIKVDIEGFEQEFLKGAMQTIKEQKPAMLISIYHNPSDFFDIKPLIESWDLGYTFKIYKPANWSVYIETVLYCEVFDG